MRYAAVHDIGHVPDVEEIFDVLDSTIRLEQTKEPPTNNFYKNEAVPLKQAQFFR